MTARQRLLTDVSSDPALVRFLSDPESYDKSVTNVTHIETHISHIFLTGRFAYKVKKPIKLPFLDFTSLDSRVHFLNRELALNRRYAGELYKELVPIYGKNGTFSFEQVGPAVDYALKMVQFNNDNLFRNLAQKNLLTSNLVEILVDQVVHLHQTEAVTPEKWGIETFSKYFRENLEALSTRSHELGIQSKLSKISEIFSREIRYKQTLIEIRRQTHVKQTHGDLHLGNICLYEDRPVMFDGLEFNDNFSCTDVWADFAFLFMDLIVQGAGDLAFVALNRYLEGTDDFEGLKLLRLYSSYRALVRAKISFLRLSQGDSTATADINRYLELGLRLLDERKFCVIAIGGLSGSGKSTISKELAKVVGAIHLRSDVIRKNILKLPLLDRAPESAYSREMTQEVYSGLLDRAKVCVGEGFNVILDAVYQGEKYREEVIRQLGQNGQKINAFWCEVPYEVAINRIRSRTNDISDANLEIYERQLSNQKP